MAGTFTQGLIEGTQARQQIEMNQLALQEQKIKVDSAKQTLQHQARVVELMNKNSPGTGGVQGSIDYVEQLAKSYAQAQMPVEAAKYFSMAEEMRDKDSLIANRATASRKAEGEYAAGLLGSVTDQKSLNEASILYTMRTGKPSPFVNQKGEIMAYNPSTIAMMRQAYLGDAASAKIDLTRERIELTKKQEELVTARKNAAERTATEQKKRNVTLAKNGAKDDTGEPPPKVIKHVRELAAKRYPDQESSALDAPSRDIAKAAMEYAKANNMEAYAAVEKIFETMAPNMFAGMKPDRGVKGDFSRPIDLTNEPSATPADRLKLQKGLIQGYYYTIINPQTRQPIKAQWDGTKFIARERPYSARKSVESPDAE